MSQHYINGAILLHISKFVFWNILNVQLSRPASKSLVRRWDSRTLSRAFRSGRRSSEPPQRKLRSLGRLNFEAAHLCSCPCRTAGERNLLHTFWKSMNILAARAWNWVAICIRFYCLLLSFCIFHMSASIVMDERVHVLSQIRLSFLTFMHLLFLYLLTRDLVFSGLLHLPSTEPRVVCLRILHVDVQRPAKNFCQLKSLQGMCFSNLAFDEPFSNFWMGRPGLHRRRLQRSSRFFWDVQERQHFTYGKTQHLYHDIHE